FAEALSNEGVFPSFVVQTVAKGESAGVLEDNIKRVAEFFQKRLESFQKVFGEMIGQVLVVVVGVAVGVFVGVFLFSIYGVLPKMAGGMTGILPAVK
ncbi:type II secretion system F family protein, partial [Patescibacteria group bacterium]|nr:type II secretion system F family protein [Patescibacteria group bacterium]